ncbi:MAG: S-adenosylmethionine:tRNA ribosyltransferase-isomerase, partial [Thermodesulfobacteriota bacterium]
MDPRDFHYHLPQELIAQYPLPERDASRLMVLSRETGSIEHRRFPDIKEYLKAGDLLIFNDTKVIPARLLGRKPTGGAVELLLIKKLSTVENGELWQCMARSSK